MGIFELAIGIAVWTAIVRLAWADQDCGVH